MTNQHERMYNQCLNTGIRCCFAQLLVVVVVAAEVAEVAAAAVRVVVVVTIFQTAVVSVVAEFAIVFFV